MKRLTKIFSAVIAIAALTDLSVASAQTSLNDVEGAITQGAQFDDARELVDERRQEAAEDATIDGEAGIFVLKKNKLFTISASAGGGYSTNPGRTLDTSQASAFGSVALRAGLNTIIGQQYDVGVNLVGTATEYEDDLGPSNRSGVANIYVGRTLFDDHLYFSIGAVGGVNTNADFKQSSTFFGGSASASYTLSISNNVVFRPSITAARQWSNRSEQNNISGTANADLIWRPAPNWIVSGGASYTYRKYDNFFEDVTFVEREDNQYRIGLSVSRRISDTSNISVSYDYTNQNSSFFLSEYDSHDGGLNLQISHRF